MTILKIYEYPEPILRVKTEAITEFGAELQKLAEDMADTMWDAPGVGLAAPQVGKSLKLIVVDISRRPAPEGEEVKPEWMALVNPEIIEQEGSQLDDEGCLSLPELTSKVSRAEKITVRFQTLTGEMKELQTERRFAVVLQHEIDHLNGILFLDHLSTLKRSLYKKKVKKWMKAEHHD